MKQTKCNIASGPGLIQTKPNWIQGIFLKIQMQFYIETQSQSICIFLQH